MALHGELLQNHFGVVIVHFAYDLATSIAFLSCDMKST
jgi:hypothetical protein